MSERDFDRDVWCLLGLPFDLETVETAAALVERAVASREQAVIATPNVNWVALSFLEPEIQVAVSQSDLSLIDGQPLVWAARFAGLPFRMRVAGSTLVEHFLKTRSHQDYRLFFLGGGEGVAEGAASRINGSSSEIQAVGWHNPGFGTVDEMSGEEVLSRINARTPDLLLVALSARKGIRWIEKNRTRLNSPVISHVGSSINLIAGRLRRAPLWMQQAGLEWVWRIFQQPILFERYLKDGLVFLYLILRYLAPLAVLRFLFLPASSSCEIQVNEREDEMEIRLRGVWDERDRPRMRELFREWARKEKHLTLDFSGTRFVDAGFLGFLLLLRKCQQSHDKRLTLTGLNRTLKLIFHLNLVDRLFRDPLPGDRSLTFQAGCPQAKREALQL